jgi:hypothetical protein
MKKSDILTAIKGKKGACVWVEWTRPVYLRAAYKGLPLTKSTRMLCRLAVDYDKKQDTIRGREDGSLPAVNAGLKGFIWNEAPTILESVKTGKLYLRLEAAVFKNARTTVEFKLDGQVVEKADYAHAMLGKETTKRERSATFNVSCEQITRVHAETCELIAEDEAEGEAEAV